MNLLPSTFSSLRTAGRKALVGYLTAGDPDRDHSLAVLDAACSSGLDVLELGVPFSDPTSDGPVIQAAAGRALKQGMTLAGVLDLAATLRARHPRLPIVLFSYYNPLLRFGLDRLAARATEAGVDGFLVVDLPPEEAGEFQQALAGRDLPLIRLIAPTTPPTRIRTLLADAGGFVYLITRTGVTGSGQTDEAALARQAAAIRAVSPLPLCLGFGISTPDDARRLAPLADGVVVGSALVKLAAERAAHGDAPQQVAAATRALRAALG